jgi:molybdenum cofactor biosynthesis enzyme MoaA
MENNLKLTFNKTRVVNLFGKEITLKNYICSLNGEAYREKPKDIKLQLTICPTSFCNASCPFCIAVNTDKREFVDLAKLKNCLEKLKEENIVRGISFTGGEPFTDVRLLNNIINLIFEIFGESMEVSVTTNGINLEKIRDIEMLSHLEALHISRHHYNDEINRKFFGIDVPSNEKLSEILHSFPFKDLFVLNCLLLKDYIGTPDEAHKFMDFAIDSGAGKVAFISCIPINDFSREQTIDYRNVLLDDDDALLFLRGYRDFNFCNCRDGVYASPSGKLIEFYGRNTSGEKCSN